MTKLSPRQAHIEITHEVSELLEKVIVQTATNPKLNINISRQGRMKWRNHRLAIYVMYPFFYPVTPVAIKTWWEHQYKVGIICPTA